MDGTLALGQSQINANAALSRLSPEKLLLLGLQLLTKNSAAKVLCAVVPPRLQSKSDNNDPGSPQSPKSSVEAPQGSPPSSPEQQQVPGSGSRKRRRGENTELSNEEKREKRKLMNRVAAQNARDRKKDYVTDLERKMAALEAKNRKLQQENQSLLQRTETLVAEKRQLEKQLRHLEPPPSLPLSSSSSFVNSNYLSSAALGEESLSEPGSAVPSSSLQQEQVLKGLLTQVLVTFDSLAHLLRDYWPDCDVIDADSGSHDSVAGVRCQSHDHHPLPGVTTPPEGTGVVGGRTVYMEPPSELNFNALLGPSDPLTIVQFPTVPDFAAPLSDSTPTHHELCCTGSDFSDLPDSELERMLSPFTSNDSSFELDCWDLESFMTA